jgi:sortase A
MTVRAVRAWLVTAFAVAGLALIGHGLWIPAKAALAQTLLDRAWERTVNSGGRQSHRAWTWADSVPLARLNFGNDTFIVLSGGSGEALAFGPAHVPDSARPGGPGLSLIAGHRDTHFRGLRTLGPGQTVSLETADGTLTNYRVREARIVHEDNAVFDAGSDDSLALVTCYPFDGRIPNGPLRFIVLADKVTPEEVGNRRHNSASFLPL